MRFARGSTILPWPWAERFVSALLGSGAYAECCLPAGCSCQGRAISTRPWLAVHYMTPHPRLTVQT